MQKNQTSEKLTEAEMRDFVDLTNLLNAVDQGLSTDYRNDIDVGWYIKERGISHYIIDLAKEQAAEDKIERERNGRGIDYTARDVLRERMTAAKRGTSNKQPEYFAEPVNNNSTPEIFARTKGLYEAVSKKQLKRVSDEQTF